MQKYASFSPAQAFSSSFFDVFLAFPVTRWNASTWRRKFFSSFPEASGILGCLGNARRLFCHARHWRASVPGRFFLGGCCLRNIGPGAFRNAGWILPQPRSAAASSCRRGSAGRLRQKTGIAWPGKREAFRCREKLHIYKEGVLFSVLGNWPGVAAQIKRQPGGLSLRKIVLYIYKVDFLIIYM